MKKIHTLSYPTVNKSFLEVFCFASNLPDLDLGLTRYYKFTWTPDTFLDVFVTILQFLAGRWRGDLTVQVSELIAKTAFLRHLVLETVTE